MTNFWRETLSTIWEKLPFLLLFLPTAVRIALQKLRPGLLRGEHPDRAEEKAPQYCVPETPAEKPVEYNVLDLDFDALSALMEDEKILALNSCCAQLSGTRKNEYTGLLADHNLILLCGESFSAAAIQPEINPHCIFGVGGLKENIVAEEYCCNADILPTILNLWGLEYDSRMLAGSDVFSDGAHVAVLSDRSFVTDKVRFSGRTGKTEYLVPDDQVPQEYVGNMGNLIDTRFRISTDILNPDCFRFALQNP